MRLTVKELAKLFDDLRALGLQLLLLFSCNGMTSTLSFEYLEWRWLRFDAYELVKFLVMRALALRMLGLNGCQISSKGDRSSFAGMVTRIFSFF